MTRCRAAVLLITLALSLWGLPASARADGPMGWLLIPSIGLYRPIGECALVDGWHDTTALGYGVCHLEGTTWLDDGWGRITLAGHTPGAFERLSTLAVGDAIVLMSWQQAARFRVTWIGIVAVGQIEYLMPTAVFMMTLITCAGNQRLIVEARQWVRD